MKGLLAYMPQAWSTAQDWEERQEIKSSGDRVNFLCRYQETDQTWCKNFLPSNENEKQ